MIFSKRLDQWLVAARKYVWAAGISLVAFVTPLYAQDQQLTSPKIEGKVIIGSATFGEDIEHKMVGAALRVYVTKRIIGTDNTFETWTASGGVGIKIFITNKLFVSPELRLGREPTVRATINVGYVFGGKR